MDKIQIIIDYYLKVQNVKSCFKKFNDLTHEQIRGILLDAGVMNKVGNRNQKFQSYENKLEYFCQDLEKEIQTKFY